MCEPTTIMMGVGLAISAVGAMQTASAQKAAGQAANNAAKYRAGIAEMNAKAREADADATRLAGRAQAARQGTMTAVERAKFVAAAAGGGVAIGEGGSAEDIAGEITGVGALDQLTVAHQANMKARNQDIEAGNLRAGAALTRFEGANAEHQGNMKSTATVIGGLGKAVTGVASKWDSFSGGGGSAWENSSHYSADAPIYGDLEFSF